MSSGPHRLTLTKFGFSSNFYTGQQLGVGSCTLAQLHGQARGNLNPSRRCTNKLCSLGIFTKISDKDVLA